MLPHAESDVGIRVPIHTKRRGVHEDLLVAVAGRIEETHGLAGADRLAAELEVLRRRPRELDHRSRPAHDLLDGRIDELRIALQLVPLAGILEQREQAPGHRIARRLVARDHQQHEVREQLDRRQQRPVHLAVADHAHDVVARGGAALLHEIVEVHEEIDPGLIDRLLRRGRVLKVRILRRDDLVGPAEQLVPIGPRHAEHLGDHGDRDLGRDVAHEVAVGHARRFVQDFTRHARDLVVHGADGARREPVARHLAVPSVVGRVHVEQVPRRPFLGRRQILREHRHPGLVQEELGLLADPDDVGVLGDRPERIDVRALVPEHRIVIPHPGPFGVWIPVLLVVLGRREIEGGGIEGAFRHGRVSSALDSTPTGRRTITRSAEEVLRVRRHPSPRDLGGET